MKDCSRVGFLLGDSRAFMGNRVQVSLGAIITLASFLMYMVSFCYEKEKNKNKEVVQR